MAAMGIDFMVRRDDLHRTRIAESDPADLQPGEARLDVSAFGLTTNNITYAVFGEAMSYWNFFPAEEGWGRVPVWGFADVAESRHDDVAEGSRVFGYFPMSSQLVVTADHVSERGFVDASPHRSELPATYNLYRLVDADLGYEEDYEDQQMLLWPLFATSFVIDDFLADNGLLNSGAAVLSSASSKTAIGTAFRLAEREGVEAIGLTSPGNIGFVEELGKYDRVVSYDEVASLPEQRAVYVDMSGDPEVRSAVHGHYGEALAYDCVVGDTHWEKTESPATDLSGPKPVFFFAPDQFAKRIGDWGPEELEKRLADAWRRFAKWTDEWLEIAHGEGPDAVERVYLELLDGRSKPSVGHVLSLQP
jgi:hypothetical protein